MCGPCFCPACDTGTPAGNPNMLILLRIKLGLYVYIKFTELIINLTPRVIFDHGYRSV